MKYGLIGEHLTHSFSKIIHNKLGNNEYELCEIAPDELDAFMKKASFDGINVTIPYKQAVIPYLDELSDTAKEIGAVNTIVNRNGKLYGHNTDFDGMKRLITKTGLILKDKNVLILGTGGTSRTATFVAYHMGAANIYRVSRHPDESNIIKAGDKTISTISYDDAYSISAEISVIINTTPLGMFPKADATPIDTNKFKNLDGLIDAIYNPLRTSFIMNGKNNGITAEGGLYMLVSQGIKASELFFAKAYSDDTYNEVFSFVTSLQENIVLTGMPGSGKSAIAEALANKTGKKYFDTDIIIKEKADMEISDIFEKYGEKHFRDLESDTIKELSSLTGIIISTGGGSVLRPENINMLKSNGHIYYIDRDIDNIIPTDDRPLSNSRETLIKRFEERHDIYLSTADTVIDNNDSIESSVKNIIKKASCNLNNN